MEGGEKCVEKGKVQKVEICTERIELSIHIVVQRIGRPAVDRGAGGSNRGDVARKERAAGGFRWLKSS